MYVLLRPYVCLSYVLTFGFVTSFENSFSLGIDLGTSGAKFSLVSLDGKGKCSGRLKWHYEPELSGVFHQSWLDALHGFLKNDIAPSFRGGIQSICVSGTSGSVLLFDIKEQKVSRKPLMYDNNILSEPTQLNAASPAIMLLKTSCPVNTAAAAPTSTLAKLLFWHFTEPINPFERLMHQADFIANSLVGLKRSTDDLYCSDWHNALKLGFDPDRLCYPEWLFNLLESSGIPDCRRGLLPKVMEPGRPIGTISKENAHKFGLPPTCAIIAGTTDSIAAFIATGANRTGQAVTSLGSTLVIKTLSSRPVRDNARGIYSHRFSEHSWLVGGASNVGCAIFRKEGYSDHELQTLSKRIDPNIESKYNYYPLTAPGERFPVNNPYQQPVLEPKPWISSKNTGDHTDQGAYVLDREEYLHGLLQGIARVEQQGYDALEQLGVEPITEVMLYLKLL